MTHIICDLVDGKDEILYSSSFSMDNNCNNDVVTNSFKDSERGSKLLNHLKNLDGRKKILLVTARWIQMQWDANYPIVD